MAYKSKYKPKFPDKYVGVVSNIICRSTWERKVCKFMDMNIPYFSDLDNKWHKYYPDFICEILDKNNKISKLIIEVKPKKQTREPKNKKSKYFLNEMRTFKINNYKWNAAKNFCDENGWQFKILTEEDIFK